MSSLPLRLTLACADTALSVAPEDVKRVLLTEGMAAFAVRLHPLPMYAPASVFGGRYNFQMLRPYARRNTAEVVCVESRLGLTDEEVVGERRLAVEPEPSVAFRVFGSKPDSAAIGSARVNQSPEANLSRRVAGILIGHRSISFGVMPAAVSAARRLFCWWLAGSSSSVRTHPQNDYRLPSPRPASAYLERRTIIPNAQYQDRYA